MFGNNLDLPPSDDVIENIGLQYDSGAQTLVYDGPAKCLLFIGEFTNNALMGDETKAYIIQYSLYILVDMRYSKR